MGGKGGKEGGGQCSKERKSRTGIPDGRGGQGIERTDRGEAESGANPLPTRQQVQAFANIGFSDTHLKCIYRCMLPQQLYKKLPSTEVETTALADP